MLRADRRLPDCQSRRCARQLTLAEVTAIVGKNFERRPDTEQSCQVCKYGDSKEKGAMRVRYFSLGSSMLNEASWRKFVESDAKGKVIERDGVLVSHFRRNKFGTDTVWFKDRQGHALRTECQFGRHRGSGGGAGEGCDGLGAPDAHRRTQ